MTITDRHVRLHQICQSRPGKNILHAILGLLEEAAQSATAKVLALRLVLGEAALEGNLALNCLNDFEHSHVARRLEQREPPAAAAVGLSALEKHFRFVTTRFSFS